MVSTVYSSDPANTPNVLYTYDEYARPVTVSQIRNGAGPSPLLASCSYTYNPTTLVIDTETVSYDTDADGTIDFSRVIDRDQDSILRPSNCELRDGNTTEHTVAYSYDSSSRLSTVTGNGLAHTYGYTPNSYSLLASVTSPSHTVSNIYEPTRNVLATKENSVASGTSVVSKYAYTVNSIGQRTNLATTGTAFTSNIALAWSYNAAGEVVAADHSDNSQDRAFQYDGIGNRQKSADSLTLPGVSNYTVNSLNQYTAVPSLPSVLTYDEDGNATSYPLPSEATSNAQLIWDAENRLIAVVKANNSTIYYSYDAQSRRTSKQIDTTPAIYYIYDGWNMIADYSIVNSSFTILNSYTWGMDMSGSMQGAGGVGGLLQVTDHSSPSTENYFPTYDGNGNVSEYLSTAGAVVAHYEYDTFGNEIVAATSGSLAQNFSHRFSTKYIDAETGFYYYGYRYYDPNVGRWPSRDPIEERGGDNLYLFIYNSPINYSDRLGLQLTRFENGDEFIVDNRQAVQSGQLPPIIVNGRALAGITNAVFPQNIAICTDCTLILQGRLQIQVTYYLDAKDNFGQGVVAHEKVHVDDAATLWNNIVDSFGHLDGKVYTTSVDCQSTADALNEQAELSSQKATDNATDYDSTAY